MRTNLMYAFDTQTNKQTSVGVIDWLFCMLALLIYCSVSLSPQTLQSQYQYAICNINPNKQTKKSPSIHPSVHPSIRTFLRFLFFNSTRTIIK